VSLKTRFDQLAVRERKLLVAFGSILAVLVLVLVPLAVGMSVGSQEDENQAFRDVIQQISDERVALSRRQEEEARVARRYASPAPSLAGFLADAADKTGVDIPETQDRSAVPHGKTFKERQTRIRLSKVGMLALSNFLEKITQTGYAVQVSHLDIQKRGANDDEYDVDIDVSAFDREEAKKAAPKSRAKADPDAQEPSE